MVDGTFWSERIAGPNKLISGFTTYEQASAGFVSDSDLDDIEHSKSCLRVRLD